jgi:hypothetical protein
MWPTASNINRWFLSLRTTSTSSAIFFWELPMSVTARAFLSYGRIPIGHDKTLRWRWLLWNEYGYLKHWTSGLDGMSD